MLPLIWTLFVVLAAWLLLVRPQRRRMAQHAALIAGLEPGHRVVTAGGIHGRIDAVDDDVVRLEIAPGTVIQLDRRAIGRDLDQELSVNAAAEDSAPSGDDDDE